MTAARSGWLVVVVLLIAAGCCVASVSSTAALLPLSVCAAVIGSTLPPPGAGAIEGAGVDARAPRRGGQARRRLMGAGLATIAADASFGLTHAVGAPAAALMTLTTLFVVGDPARPAAAILRLSGGCGRHLTQIVSVFAASGQTHCCDVRAFEDAELCHAWRVSFRTLQRQASVERTLLVVRHRQALLDEFERRNTAGLEAWLASEPEPGDALRSYLGERRDAGPMIDWSHLIPGDDC
jgi:hypothetical protein